MPRRNPDRSARSLLALTALPLLGIAAGLAADAGGKDSATGRAVFTDNRDPPPRRALDPQQKQAFDLGVLVFNTPFVAAGTPNAARRDGLGPLFISASCDACHNNGARGRPPDGNGLSNSFVMQLNGAASPYGAVLNTAALPDHSREGLVSLSWTTHTGHYPDGAAWTLHEPHYALTHLLYGPPPAATILSPRIAPAIFGDGLLEAVPDSALRGIRGQQPRAVRGDLAAGRFGWQAAAKDVADQTGRAFAREMGLTSRLRPQDDCTDTQVACRNAPQGGSPEVSDAFLDAVLAFQHELAVPARSVPQQEVAGRELFERTGCAACHVPELPVTENGSTARIDAYTDLLLHDLGDGLADRREDGRIARSQWRTAPLWGMAHALAFGDVALLHDGRAASLEEAVLWHDGQARAARKSFENLSAAQRALLLDWVGSL